LLLDPADVALLRETETRRGSAEFPRDIVLTAFGRVMGAIDKAAFANARHLRDRALHGEPNVH
jgi:hypothetical protein